MKLPDMPFTVTDRSKVEPVEHPGEAGTAIWRTFEVPGLRVRMVEYSPGYVADHWCDRGHVFLVLAGELVSELKDGGRTTMTAGMSYQVSDFGDAAHRSSTETGATMFVVD